MNERGRQLARVRQAIGDRGLIWFGPRSADAKPLQRQLGLEAVFSLTTPLGAPEVKEEVCLEELEGLRRETNVFDHDAPPSPEWVQLQDALGAACEARSVLMPYRSSSFTAASVFQRLEAVSYVAPGAGQVSLLDNKPWVELQLREADVSVLPWRYVATGDRHAVVEAVSAGPVVARNNTSGGGGGIQIVGDVSEVEEEMPEGEGGFFAASPYLEDSIPLNVHGCAFPDGSVTMHARSVQLIGIGECIRWPLGYCGNDFAVIRELETQALDDLDLMALRVGRWLHRDNFQGAFGIDALLHDGTIYFVELNPRFQGSSALAAELDEALELPDVYLDHLAAFLGDGPAGRPSLREMAHEQPRLAQAVCYSLQNQPLLRAGKEGDLSSGAGGRFLAAHFPGGGVAIGSGAKMFSLRAKDKLAPNGYKLDAKALAEVRRLRSLFADEGEEVGLEDGAPSGEGS